jgi:hypothetical protein
MLAEQLPLCSQAVAWLALDAQRQAQGAVRQQGVGHLRLEMKAPLDHLMIHDADVFPVVQVMVALAPRRGQLLVAFAPNSLFQGVRHQASL